MRNDKAIEVLKSECYVLPFLDGDRATLINTALDVAIEALKAQKVGHWEYVQYDYNPNIGNWHCSECRNIVIECADKNKDGGIPTYSYCPKCGARMEDVK